MGTTETTRRPGQSFIDQAFSAARRGDREMVEQCTATAKRLGYVMGQMEAIRLQETLAGDR